MNSSILRTHTVTLTFPLIFCTNLRAELRAELCAEFQARDHFKEALGREKEAGESKLNQIINQVCDKATVAGQGETLLLKAHIIEEELERKRRAERQQQMAAVAAAAAAVNNNNNNSYNNNNGGGGGGGQVIRQRVGTKTVDDEVATEQAREAREKVLAAQAVLRVAAVKAKQDRGEAAKVAEFQTKMDQLQRDLQVSLGLGLHSS